MQQVSRRQAIGLGATSGLVGLSGLAASQALCRESNEEQPAVSDEREIVQTSDFTQEGDKVTVKFKKGFKQTPVIVYSFFYSTDAVSVDKIPRDIAVALLFSATKDEFVLKTFGPPPEGGKPGIRPNGNFYINYIAFGTR